MAYVVDSVVTAEDAATTTSTVVLPSHIVDDLLVISITTASGATAIASAPSGWTELTPRPANISGQRQQVYYQVVTSAPVADPTFTLGASYTAEAHAFVIRGADTTTPIDGFGTTNVAAASGTGTTPTLSTTVDDCIVLYSVSAAIVTNSPTTNRSNAVPINRSKLSGTIAMTSAYRNQRTTGAIPTFTIQKQLITGSAGMTIFTIAIRDDGNGKFGPDQSQIGTEISPYAFVGQETIADLTAIPFATLGGTSTASAACTETISTGEWLAPTYLTSVEAIDAWIGGIDTVALDLSDTTTVLQATIGISGSSVRYGPKGTVLAIADSSNNWAAFRTATKAQATGRQTVYLDTTHGTRYEESVTPIDLSDITKLIYLTHRDNDTGSIGTTGTLIQDVVVYNSSNVVFIGGCAEYPISPLYMHRRYSASRNASSSLQGVGQFILNSAFTLGDGSTPSYVDMRYISIETPLAYSSTQFRWNNDSTYITINASASDIMLFNNSILNANVGSFFAIDSGSSTSATYDFTGLFLKNFDVTWKTGVTCDGLSFDGCDIDFKGAVVTNASIINPRNGVGAILTDGAGVTQSTLETAVSADYAIEITEAGDYDLTDTVFTGFTTDINVTPVTGTVTILLAQGQTVPTYTSAGATVVFDQPIPTQSVTISNGVVGTRLQIYDLTSSTELYNDVPASFPYVWTDASPYVADREIRVRASYYDVLDAKKFVDVVIGTSTELIPDLSYRLNQEEDTVYVNNAIDGITVTGVTIDDAGFLIELDTGSISWKSIYAYEVYWLSTAVGIADEGKIIEAIDEASYVLYDFKIKNITSPEVPLTITDGYGFDSVTRTTIELFDTTGGAIFAAPDRVISYAVGSGLSPTEQTDLALIKARTAIIPSL